MRDSSQSVQQTLYEHWARENQSNQDDNINLFEQSTVKPPYESLRPSADYYEAIEVDKEGLLKWESLCRSQSKRESIGSSLPLQTLKEAFSIVSEESANVGKSCWIYRGILGTDIPKVSISKKGSAYKTISKGED